MQHRASIGFVFAIVLIDMLGFGIVMPVMPRLIMDLGHMSIDSAAVFAGWLGAGYAVMQFVFAPIIGNLSDRYGRRPVLLASVLAMGIDYTILGFAPALWFLVIGRVVAGMTGASWSAAYAYIADITPPDKRAASFGMMGMAFGFGFIAGPALAGCWRRWGRAFRSGFPGGWPLPISCLDWSSCARASRRRTAARSNGRAPTRSRRSTCSRGRARPCCGSLPRSACGCWRTSSIRRSGPTSRSRPTISARSRSGWRWPWSG